MSNTWVDLLISCRVFYLPLLGHGSQDENNLVEYMFESQGYNPLIRPVQNQTERVKVDFGMALVQLISVVSNKPDEWNSFIIAHRFSPLFLFLLLSSSVISTPRRRAVDADPTGLGSDDEVRLVGDLFDSQGYNPLIRPVRNLTDHVDVLFGLAMIQLINVVSGRLVI